MKLFIEVTTSNNKLILLNATCIEMVVEAYNGREITMSGSGLTHLVKETYDQIKALIDVAVA